MADILDIGEYKKLLWLRTRIDYHYRFIAPLSENCDCGNDPDVRIVAFYHGHEILGARFICCWKCFRSKRTIVEARREAKKILKGKDRILSPKVQKL